MAAFADYTYYLDTYGGTLIPAEAFEKAMRDASREVNRYTLERAEAVLAANSDLSLIEKIKFAACAVAEVIYQYGNQIMGRRDIASESVGDHSVSYLSADQLRANEVHAITETINGYLGLTGLMFLG
jgi:hypothetical protein